MVGHVVEPAAGAVTGPRPLVLFLHGRHSVCYDPDRPRRRRRRVAVPGAGARRSRATSATTTSSRCSPRRATRPSRCASTASTPRTTGSPTAAPTPAPRSSRSTSTTGPASRPSTSSTWTEVVLVGHSRGGEGVDRASIQIPLSAPYRIAGQVLVAPTNFGAQTAAYVPTVTLLPYCDGDVSRPAGPEVHRRRPRPGRRRHLAEELGAGDGRQPQLLQHRVDAGPRRRRRRGTTGAATRPATAAPKHADRLTAEEQQAVGTAYIAGAVHLFADGDAGRAAALRRHPRAGRVDRRRAGAQPRDRRRPRRPRPRTSARTARCPTARPPGSAAAPSPSSGSPRALTASSFGWVWPHWTESYENAPTRAFLEMGWTAGRAVRWAVARRAARPERRPARAAHDRRPRERAGGAAGPGHRRERRQRTCSTRSGVLPAISGGYDTAKYWAQALVVDPSERGGCRPDQHRAGRPGGRHRAGPAVGRRPRGRTGRARRRSPTSGSPPSTSAT